MCADMLDRVVSFDAFFQSRLVVADFAVYSFVFERTRFSEVMLFAETEMRT